MRINNSTTGLTMPRDPVDQYRQADTRFIESADSLARAIDYNRQQRAEFLEAMLLIDLNGFDKNFRDFYREDRAIVLVLSNAAAQRGLSLIQLREVQ